MGILCHRVAAETDMFPMPGQRGTIIDRPVFFDGTEHSFIYVLFFTVFFTHILILTFFPEEQQIYFSDELHRMKLESK